MKAKLYKVLDQYHLYDGDKAIATTIVGNPMLLPNLSKQNCDEIFGSYNPKSMMKDILSNCSKTKEGYILGFKMAMELNKDKVFTLDDMRKAIQFGEDNTDMDSFDTVISDKEVNEFIQSLQQPTEIDVVIVMEDSIGIGDKYTPEPKPLLDSEGCLILKRK
jgi:hypothetical protein